MTAAPSFDTLRTDRDGLVPCVIQDADTREVLMVGYQNREAWDKTAETGLVHFHSRSRNTLWLKGETSGNTLSVVSTHLDCDSDAVLISTHSAGPTCHTGSVSCFTSDAPVTLGTALDRLAATIKKRASADPTESYTATLIANGDLAARKTLEEAGELAFAAKDTATGSTDQRVVEEAADLFYHALVLLAQQGVESGRVAQELTDRSS